MGEGFDASEDGTGRGTPLVVAFSVRGRGDGAGVEVMPDGVAPALRAATGGASRSATIIDGERVRRLTPTECERLQGFPDGWTLLEGPPLARAPSWYQLSPEERPREPYNPPPHGPRYEAMGRAVTVPVAEAIGRRLLSVVSDGPAR